jgi:hypothetical protein
MYNVLGAPGNTIEPRYIQLDQGSDVQMDRLGCWRERDNTNALTLKCLVFIGPSLEFLFCFGMI